MQSLLPGVKADENFVIFGITWLFSISIAVVRIKRSVIREMPMKNPESDKLYRSYVVMGELYYE